MKIKLILFTLLIPLALFAQTKYRYVIVPDGTDPNTLSSGGSGTTAVTTNLAIGFRAYNTNAIATTGHVFVKTPFSTNIAGAFMTDNCGVFTNNCFTCTNAGYWNIVFSITSDRGYEIQPDIRVNGISVGKGYDTTYDLGSGQFILGPYYLNVNDYVEGYFQGQTGRTDASSTNHNDTYFAGWKIGSPSTVISTTGLTYNVSGGADSGFHATLVNNQDIGVNVITKLAFSNETYDSAGWYSPTDCRYTIKTNGIYSFTIAVSGLYTPSLLLFKNGSSVVNAYGGNQALNPVGGARADMMLLSCIVTGLVNDYFEAYAGSNSGMTADKGATNTFFSGCRLGGL